MQSRGPNSADETSKKGLTLVLLGPRADEKNQVLDVDREEEKEEEEEEEEKEKEEEEEEGGGASLSFLLILVDRPLAQTSRYPITRTYRTTFIYF